MATQKLKQSPCQASSDPICSKTKQTKNTQNEIKNHSRKRDVRGKMYGAGVLGRCWRALTTAVRGTKRKAQLKGWRTQ